MINRTSLLFIGIFLIVRAFAHAADETPSFGAGSTPPPEVLKFLQDMKKQYGPDTVALVSWLLDATNQSGSVLTSSIKVNGDETKDNTRFLVFLVDTGLILNEKTTDQNNRLLAVWERILTKAFLHMDTIHIPADGVLIDLLYHRKSFPETDNIANHVDEPGPIEEAKFYIHGDSLRAFMKKELSAQQLLNRTQVVVDGNPIVPLSAKEAQKL
ncbi:MAG TPA: hypothetical protein VNN62_14970 [Methylomirabilota bacterium]|nr:hypothetical protein [Methylomirabilota bacterium]